MNALAYVMNTVPPNFQGTEMTTSSFYDLIDAIGNEAEPDEERLIVWAVLDLLKSGRIKWAKGHRDLRRIR